jgi:lysylphosphatidylglycerol synthetase-like protein (DUF2156 family)
MHAMLHPTPRFFVVPLLRMTFGTTLFKKGERRYFLKGLRPFKSPCPTSTLPDYLAMLK